MKKEPTYLGSFNYKALKSAYQIIKDFSSSSLRVRKYILEGVRLKTNNKKLILYSASRYIGVRIKTDFIFNTDICCFIPRKIVMLLLKSTSNTFEVWYKNDNYYICPQYGQAFHLPIIEATNLCESLDQIFDKMRGDDVSHLWGFNFSFLNTLYKSQKEINSTSNVIKMKLSVDKDLPIILSSEADLVMPPNTKNPQAKWEGLIMPVHINFQ